MVTFESTPGREFSTLRIVGLEEDKVTTLECCTPLYRGCAAKWPSFRTSNSERNRNWSSVQEKILHLKGSDQESSDPTHGFHFLGSMIYAGHVQWRGPLKIRDNFEYIPGYWEWAEDVLSRCGDMLVNASLTGVDLLELRGLSVTGRLFDEVVPIDEFLSQSLSDKARIPESCRFLILGYQYLATESPDERVSIFSWIGFWNHSFRSYVGYEEVNRSTSKVTSLDVCPRTSYVVEHRPWDSAGRHPFDILRVGVDLEKEVAESCPPSLPIVTIAQQAETILHIGASSLWFCICSGLKGKSPDMVLKEEESSMKAFEVLSQIGWGNFADLHDKLQGFFQMEKERCMQQHQLLRLTVFLRIYKTFLS
ncbi:hypothetical protein LIER_40914 [Lithospermum erythrorhizon]|uniref:Aminotransferase-like plant mobile domain-containing protein n=1 Tax=Lithospermum erythrorhizon TaxID=34254 RepID=A0AAV3R3L8_LITER